MPASSDDAVAPIAEILRDPEFHEFVHRRSRLAWTLSALMAAIYFGFILLVAFAPALLAMPLAGTAVTLGIPLGVGVILSAFVLTGLYIRRANVEFDRRLARIVERHT